MSSRSTRITRSNIIRYYVNFQAKSKEHAVKHASTEQIDALIDFITNNTDNNLFLFRGVEHAKKLAKFRVFSASDPDSDTTLPYLLKRFFCRFDFNNGRKYSDFRSKFPKYNPATFKWQKYIDNFKKHQDDDEIEPEIDDEPGEDPQHWSQQAFRDTIDEEYGSPDRNHNHNTNNGSMNNNNITGHLNQSQQDSLLTELNTDPNGEPSPSPALIQQNPQTPATIGQTPQNPITPLNQSPLSPSPALVNIPTTALSTAEVYPRPTTLTFSPGNQSTASTHQPHPLATVIDYYIKHYEEFEDRVGAVNAQQARLTTATELTKFLSWHNIPIDDQIIQSFMALYREMGILDIRAALTTMVLEANEYFMTHGFRTSDGRYLKLWQIRLNSTLGIDPNTNPNVSQSQQTVSNHNRSSRKRTALNTFQNPAAKRLRPNNHPTSTTFQLQPTISPSPSPVPQSLSDVRQQRAQRRSNQSDQVLIQQPQSLGFIQHRQIPQLPQQPPNVPTHYTQTIPNHPPQPYFQYQNHLTDQNQLNRMLNQFSKTVQRPEDPMKKNPYFQHLDENINNTSRDVDDILKGDAVHMVKKEVVVQRICKIAEGPTLDAKMRNLCKMLNTATNKEVADELQGKTIFSLFILGYIFLFSPHSDRYPLIPLRHNDRLPPINLKSDNISLAKLCVFSVCDFPANAADKITDI